MGGAWLLILDVADTKCLGGPPDSSCAGVVLARACASAPRHAAALRHFAHARARVSVRSGLLDRLDRQVEPGCATASPPPPDADLHLLVLRGSAQRLDAVPLGQVDELIGRVG